jgi:hypothetical protein
MDHASPAQPLFCRFPFPEHGMKQFGYNPRIKSGAHDPWLILSGVEDHRSSRTPGAKPDFGCLGLGKILTVWDMQC